MVTRFFCHFLTIYCESGPKIWSPSRLWDSRDDGWFKFSLWVHRNLKNIFLSWRRFCKYLHKYKESMVENWATSRFRSSNIMDSSDCVCRTHRVGVQNQNSNQYIVYYHPFTVHAHVRNRFTLQTINDQFNIFS